MSVAQCRPKCYQLSSSGNDQQQLVQYKIPSLMTSTCWRAAICPASPCSCFPICCWKLLPSLQIRPEAWRDDDTVPLSNQNLLPVPREPDLLCLEAQLDCYHSTIWPDHIKGSSSTALHRNSEEELEPVRSQLLLHQDCRIPAALHQEHCNSVLCTTAHQPAIRL